MIWSLLVALLPTATPDAELFTARVRPILAAHCFKCHGPDDTTRKAKLRLDRRDDAARVIGQPGASELLRRINSTDAAEQMPPPHAKIPLSAGEIQALTTWVQRGAPYAEHWAFVAPKRPPVPTTASAARHPIDAFVDARLASEHRSRSPEADRATLARRVYLDLIGVPPTPAEADAFLNDPTADAYERLVQRLLADPRYGERWARRWLDLARYADTNGYEKDRPRSVWPYRDWVITAINADMPFDQFTVEQLAGDLLPQATEAQRIATGFHRNTMLNEEGGIDPLEFRFHAMTDRVATTGTVWLGLTLGCAQCHTHKFDPVPQREYYSLFALLNNADEPTMDVRSSSIETRRREIQTRIDALLAELPGKIPAREFETLFAAWIAEYRAKAASWRVLRPLMATSNLPLLTVQPDDSVFASGDQTKSDTYRLRFRSDRAVSALRLEALPDDRLPGHGPGRTYYEGPFGDFTLCDFKVFVNGKPVRVAKATHSYASGGFTADKAIDDNLQTGWSIAGGQGRAHYAVFQLAEPLPPGEFEMTMLFERHFSAGLGRFRVTATNATPPPDARDVPNEIEALLERPDSLLSGEDRAALRRYFITTTPRLAKERQAIDTLRKQMPSLPTTLVMQERPPENPRPTFVHHRGEFLQPAERVEPGVLSVLPPLRSRAPNRLDFARWLVAPDNPLTARVTVNRHWAAFFGTGLVRTLQDFGYTGDAPSHPELLDWLATELIRDQWSIKRLHSLIVTSATYRQSSRRTDNFDPDNRLLSRGPRVRLESEAVRDGVLRAAGLLSQKMNGPSVFPPQPASVTTEGTYGQIAWKASEGEDRYRRGLYTFMKRTAPFAMGQTFDGPSGEVCVARREVSNTPLQALTMLNDVALTEAAQALGREFADRRGSVAERLDSLFRRCLVRGPLPVEHEALHRFFDHQRVRFTGQSAEALKFAGPGPQPDERAAWAAVARALFNVDEFIVKE